MGPIVASGSQVVPALSSAKTAARRSTTRSATARCTMRRDPATHTWPAFRVMARATVRTVRSRSGASANTTCGLLPPNSSVTGLVPLSAQAAMMAAPLRVDPVNVTFAMRGWRHKAAPAPWPSPWTMLKIPGGMPASMASSASRSTENGVISEGLRTTALPAASAGATFHEAITSGRFQGAMAAITP